MALAASVPNGIDPRVITTNRVSDLLFVTARAVNHRAGLTEIEW